MFSYCENADFFLSQPLNVISNLAFLIVAWQLYKHTNQRIAALFAVIIFATSATSHILQTPIALLVDIIAVAVICVILAYSIIHPYYSRATTIIIVSVACVSSWLASIMAPIDSLYSSAFLIPLILLVGLAMKPTARRKHYIAASLTLALAIVFRAIDLRICDIIPFGTHWLWHIGSAISLYFICLALPDKRKSA